jgi:hypothetical protein
VYARIPSAAMMSAATTNRMATTIIAHAPPAAIPETPSAVAIVLNRLYAVTSDAAMVVTYMNTIGRPA